MRLLVLSDAKFVGFVKCLLKELAMVLLVLWEVLLNLSFISSFFFLSLSEMTAFICMIGKGFFGFPAFT